MRSLRLRRVGLGLGATLLVLSSNATLADAAGLTISDRGARPLGRGGAFVAGADDLGAISYNPAGIYDAGGQFLIDASTVLFGSTYTRQALLRQVDPNTGETVATYEQTFPTVEGEGGLNPIPTVAASFFVHPDWVLAFGLSAPYATAPTYPEEVDGGPAPQRYSLISLEGSALAIVGGYVAWRPVDELRIGAGLELMVGAFNTRVDLSGCLPDRFFCAPEDPEWDVAEEISAAPIVTPSGNIGLIWEFYDGWRLGGSFHLPFWVEAPATLTTRLASAAPYRNAEQIGEDATVSFQLPWTVRLGIEARDLTPGLRIEVAGTYEHWAIHDAITVEPDGIAITNLPAFPEEYFLPAIEIPRKFQSAVKGHLGAEYFIVASDLVGVTPRLGVSYETSAIAEENVSVLTIDSGKVATSVGLSVHIGDARIDAVYSHQFTQQVEVAAADARIPQVVPLQANTPENPDYINGGIYDWRVDVIGLGFAYTFDKPTPANATPPVEATPDPTTGEKPATPKPLPKDPEVPEEVEPPAETDEDA